MFDLFRSRDKAVRILLGVILGLVAISMVTYLIPGAGGTSMSGEDGTVIAKVGDESITTIAAQAAVQNAMRGQRLPPSMMGFFAPQVVQGLINERALEYEAKRLGIAVSDDDVASTIRQELPPSFFDKDNKIDQNLLAQALSQQNMTVPQFVEDTRRQIMAQRLRGMVDSGVVVTKTDLESEYKHRNEKVKIAYVLVKPSSFEQQVQVTPADVEAYYKSHKQDYQTPEKKSLAIIVLDPAKVESTINPSDAELQTVYNSSLDRFRSPERVKVRHILITTDSNTTDAQAQAKATDLLKQIKAGGDFADLAKKNSKDPGSAAQGGDLGFVSRGQMVKPFEDAAFSLKPGELSGLVKTTYGYHIVQGEAREDAHLKPFAEVKDTLVTEYRKRRANEMMQQLADRAAAELKKDPAHPEKAAQDVNGELVRADNVKLGDPLPQIGVSQELQTALASLKAGAVSQPVAVSTNKIAVALVTAATPAHPSALDEVRSQVEASVRRQKLDDMVNKRTTELLAKAKADGNDLAKASKDLGLDVKESNDFNRQGAVEGFGSAATLSEAFSSKDGTVLGPLNAADGKAVVKVLSHTGADMSGFAAQEATMRTEMKTKISRERTGLFEDGIRKKLEDEHKVKVQQDVLNRFLQSMKGSA